MCGVESLHLLSKGVISMHIAHHRSKRQMIHRLGVEARCTVLHTSAILAFVFMFGIVLVSHYNLVVLVGVDFAASAHLLALAVVPSWLYAKMLVHLCLHYTEFVHLCLGCHAQATVAAGTCRKTCPEVGIFVDHACIVTNGSAQIARLVEQQGTVVYSQNVIGLHTYHIVEVGDSAVVVAQLHTQQSTVVMSQKVVGIEIERRVVVGHGATQIVHVVSCQGTVDVVAYTLGFKVYRLAQICIGIAPLAS